MVYPVGLHGYDPNSADWDSHTVFASGRERLTTKVLVEAGFSAWLGVEVHPELNAAFVRIDCNPSRLARPDSWELAAARFGRVAVAKTVDLVADSLVAYPACGLDDLRVTRVDAARDFSGVERPGELIRGLGPLPRPWSRLNLVHADASRFGAQTLMVGSGAGVARLYDKHQETEGKAPGGTLRFEAEARKDWSKKYGGIKVLSDVTDENVSELARNRWDWAQMGAEVLCTGAALCDRLQGIPGLSAAKRRGFLGWLVEQSAGFGSDIGFETAAQYRALQREYGIVVGDLFSPNGLQVLARLDFDEGREVLRVA